MRWASARWRSAWCSMSATVARRRWVSRTDGWRGRRMPDAVTSSSMRLRTWLGWGAGGRDRTRVVRRRREVVASGEPDVLAPQETAPTHAHARKATAGRDVWTRYGGRAGTAVGPDRPGW